MHTILKYQKILAGFLVSALIAPLFPLAALAQTIPVAGASSGSQSGNALSSIVQDTTGAVAAAAIACNKENIHSGIASLFASANNSGDGQTDQSAASAQAAENTAINNAGMPAATDGSSLNTGGAFTSGGTSDTPSPDISGTSTAGTGTGTTDTTTAATITDATTTDGNDQQVHLAASSPANTNLAAMAAALDRISAASNKTASATVAQTNKVTCTNAIEKAAAGVILRQLTISTVNWINHGLNGNPFYSTDTTSALKSVRDTAIKSLANTLGFDSKNYPFGKAIAQSIANQVGSSYEQQARYSLNAVIAQQYPGMTNADFQRNFGIGGWEAFLAQTALNNNPFGFAMQAQDVAASRIAGTAYSPAQDLKDQLARSGGFFDQKVCVDPNYNPKANAAAANAADSAAADKLAAADAADAAAGAALAQAQASGDAAAIAAAQARYNAANVQDAQAANDLAKADAADAAANASSVCSKYVVQTPGSTIGQQLTKALGATNDTLINGQDLSTDITAIFNALMNQLINKGLSSLSTTNPNSSNFANNSNGTQANNASSVSVSGQEGSWASQGTTFNVFTDIPSVIRYEDNSQSDTTLATGCTSAVGFSPTGQFCAGDPRLPEGYQQILSKEINTERNIVAEAYELDYCVPGPRPGAIDTIEQNAVNYVNNPNLFPQSVDAGTLHKFLSNYGKTIGVLAGAATGAAIGSAVGPWGTVIGAVAGAITGAILTAIGNNHDFKNEKAYSAFVQAILGVDIPTGGGARANFNGFKNASNVVTTLAGRYAEAMHMVYAPTLADVNTATNAATANPDGVGLSLTPAATLNTPNVLKDIPDLSTNNTVRQKIETAGYNALSGPASDLSDVIAFDTSEYSKIAGHTANVAQNDALFANSQSVEGQLERLLVRINQLPTLDGYPGVTGPLDLVPIVTVNGDKIMTLNVGDAFVDPGATATDKTDGVITSNIVVGNNVNTSAAGIYTVTYDVTDSQGIAAVQQTRSVRVVDATGSVGHIVTNPAVKNYSGVSAAAAITGTAGIAVLNQAASQPATVRDYQKDLLAIQNVTNLSNLTPYEAELKRIDNTFQQLAPYIHGTDDLKQEEVTLDTMNNEQSQLAFYPAGTSVNGEPASGALRECIDATASGSTYQKDGGPLGRVPFYFVLSNVDTTPVALPSWITDLLPPTYSFLPDWHYAQGQGQQLEGKDWFPNDGVPAYSADIQGKLFGVNGYDGPHFTNFHGDNMVAMNGIVGIDTDGPVTLDENKLIRNDDVGQIDEQGVKNAFQGLEGIVGVY